MIYDQGLIDPKDSNFYIFAGQTDFMMIDVTNGDLVEINRSELGIANVLGTQLGQQDFNELGYC